MIQTIKIAEKHGFEVVHGIIDSIYVKKKHMSEQEVKSLAQEIQQTTRIPVSFEGMFKWIVFLPSVTDSARPVPARYYGVFTNNSIKARGLEVRQTSSPLVVQYFQQQVLETLAKYTTKKDMLDQVELLGKLLRYTIKQLPQLDTRWLTCPIRLSKTEYKHNILQKRIVYLLKRKGLEVLPGKMVRFIFQKTRIVLPVDYNGKPNVQQYTKLLIRSLYVVLQPFGIQKEQVIALASQERQTNLKEYTLIVTKYIPIKKTKRKRQGLSEYQIRNHLEREGWLVWRGGALNMLKQDELYPNVRRKYEKLHKLMQEHYPDIHELLQYLCHVHHGMPDFLCYRNNEFKFVECKLGYEQVSKRQRICFRKLQSLGFIVEIHRLAEDATKTRMASVNLQTGQKIILQKQMMLRNYPITN